MGIGKAARVYRVEIVLIRFPRFRDTFGGHFANGGVGLKSGKRMVSLRFSNRFSG